jgi:hypothetical protein
MVAKAKKHPTKAAPPDFNLVHEIEKTLWRDKWLSVPIFALAVLAIASSSFLYLYHGSLAPVYVANVRVSARESETAVQDKLIANSSNYKLAIKDSSGQVLKYPLAKVGV